MHVDGTKGLCTVGGACAWHHYMAALEPTKEQQGAMQSRWNKD
jgi:hypothetical protein